MSFWGIENLHFGVTATNVLVVYTHLCLYFRFRWLLITVVYISLGPHTQQKDHSVNVVCTNILERLQETKMFVISLGKKRVVPADYLRKG